MTSGVKQALPQQILVPKSGTHGKGARPGDAPADFAEALAGKSPAGPPSGMSRHDTRGSSDTQALPRFAFRLGEMNERTQPPSPDAANPGADEDAQSAAMASSDGTAADQATSVPFIVMQVAAQKPEMSSRFRVNTGQADDTADADTPRRPSPRREADTIGEKGKPVPFAPTSGGVEDVAAPTEPSAKTLDGSDAPAMREARSRPSPVETAREPVAPRIAVVSQQAVPAPVASTAAMLAGTIAASDLIEPSNARLVLEAVNASTAQAPAHSLKIQLHPAELGMVTATLRFAGDQLSIDLQVENHEAYRRLVADRDTILGSLRDIGYDVDRVTVLQPPAAARSDSASSLPSRSFDQSGSGMAQGDASDSGERASGQRESDRQNPSREGQQRPDPAREGGAGLYI